MSSAPDPGHTPPAATGHGSPRSAPVTTAATPRSPRRVDLGRLALGILALLLALFTAGPALTGTSWLPHLAGSTWLFVLGAACVVLGLLGLARPRRG